MHALLAGLLAPSKKAFKKKGEGQAQNGYIN